VNEVQPCSQSSGSHGRDPVALLVDEQLCELAQDSGSELRFGSKKDGDVEVRFGTVTTCGENRDIAVLRLASELLDDDRFALTLIQTLKSPVGKSTMDDMS
jgi:hypothetical protein